METEFSYIPYRDTGNFSDLVIDYLNGKPDVRSYYKFSPNEYGIAQAIQEREKCPVNRNLLSTAFSLQYEGLEVADKVRTNIELLKLENTYTICTAHQPNLMTGYLYFIYKILHVIKLSDELKAKYPSKNFVPVFYSGNEDNDIEELGVFHFNGATFRWEGDGQKGAVGRMKTESLKPLLHVFNNIIGPPGDNCEHLMQLITDTYHKHETIGKATQYLLNQLFGKYGLLILNPDDTALKATFAGIIKTELLNQTSYQLLKQEELQRHGKYKSQAYARPINIFYLKDGMRERIEQKDDKYVIINTSLEFTKQEIIEELSKYPERFSPNVILRGLFQESILPNVAFVGGGAEVAYWLQLKSVFEHYGVFYPCILLRQSVLWKKHEYTALQQQLEISDCDLFLKTERLVEKEVALHSTTDWKIATETADIAHILNRLEQKANNVDATLQKAASSTNAKITKLLTEFQKKMFRAEKKKAAVRVGRIRKLKEVLFPNDNLQERFENFTEYYIEYGEKYFEILLEGIAPLRNEFLIVKVGNHHIDN